jgi:hypothetical protein
MGAADSPLNGFSAHVNRGAGRTGTSLAHQLSRAFTLFGALVAAGFFITALAYGICQIWLTPEFERSRLAIRAEGAAYAAMIDEENGLRGYLMTRDDRFLEAYTSGELRLVRANEALSRYAASVPEVGATMLGARLAEEKWREQWAKAAADTRPGVFVPEMSKGKALFDAYRGDEAAFADALNERSEALSVRDQRGKGPGATPGITASFGVAEFLAATRTPRSLVEAADAAMYESKHAGRNRVVLSATPPFALGTPEPKLQVS